MVLPMARPQLRTGSHVYCLRKRIPADLVTVVGSREVTLSLKTKDPVESKHLMALEAAKREAHDIAAPCTMPCRRTEFTAILADGCNRAGLNPPASRRVAIGGGHDLGCLITVQPWCHESAARVLQDRGLVADKEGRRKGARADGAAVQRASLALQRMTRGEMPDGQAAPSAPALRYRASFNRADRRQ